MKTSYTKVVSTVSVMAATALIIGADEVLVLSAIEQKADKRIFCESSLQIESDLCIAKIVGVTSLVPC